MLGVMARVLDAFSRARLRPGPVDGALALLLAAGAQVELWLGALPGPIGANLTAALLTTLPLAWRTVAPLTTVALTAGGFTLAVLLGMPADEPLVAGLAPLVALYSVGVHSATSGLIAAAAIALAASAVDVGADQELGLSHLALLAAVTVGALAVGRAVRVMGFETDVLEARTAELERERDEKARAAVATERARIARELHDVIGHSISVMGVQAGAVRRLLPAEQERERETLLAVERTGRDAVGEMRRLLGFLRSDEQAALGEPPPTLRRVDDLVEEMRRAGLQVELRVEGELDDLSPGRALAAFRILQEALTNALKHAPGAHVRAILRRTPAELRIEVMDDSSASPPAGPGGYGLVGMRERLALYGGTLEAGPGADGGFSVVARLPTVGD
jgi:signal transduction histidine kinase